MVNPGPNPNTNPTSGILHMYQHVGLIELCLVIYGSRRLNTAVRAYMLFHHFQVFHSASVSTQLL